MITRCVLNKRFGMIVFQLRLDMSRQIGSKPMHSGAPLARALGEGYGSEPIWVWFPSGPPQPQVFQIGIVERALSRDQLDDWFEAKPD
jgi:hypothetical protein